MDILKDIRYGIRLLRRNPGFAFAAIAILTLTIGASTAAFSIVNGILLQPLPFREAEQLVNIVEIRSDDGSFRDFFDPQTVRALLDGSRTLTGWAASSMARANLDSDGPPEIVEVTQVTDGYFDVLGVRTVTGRLFASDELLPAGTKPAVISYGYWQAKWGGASDVAGQTLRLEGYPAMTIIGVLPSGFRSPLTAGLPTPVWVSADPASEGTLRRQGVIGRLNPGESVESAQAEIQAIARRMADDGSGNQDGVRVMRLADRVVEQDSRRTLLIFAVAVGMVLLIGILNLVNLQASRISMRQQELSVRGALGASPYRLMRQMVAEAMVLTLSGAGLGYLFVYSIRDVALAKVPPMLPRIADVPVDTRVFAFAILVALLSGLAIGIVPVLRATGTRLTDTLRDGAPGITDTRRRRGMSRLLTVVQTSLAVVLLVAAGLLIQSVERLISVDTGFDGDDVIVADVSLPRRYAASAAQGPFFVTLLDEVRSLPGVVYASVTQQIPMSGNLQLLINISADGTPSRLAYGAASSDFDRVLGLPLLSGRWISETDVATGAPVAVVSESMVRQFWPGQDPIGQVMETLGLGPPAPTVIGVVGELKYRMRNQSFTPGFYVPFTSELAPERRFGAGAAMTLALKTMPGALISLEQVLDRIEPDAVLSASSMDRLIRDDIRRERFQTSVLTSFAGLALVLALFGIYSVVAFATAQRSREIGLRMALGARPAEVIVQMMREGLGPALLGLALGLGGAAGLARFLESYLFEVQPGDSGTYAGVLIAGSVLLVIAAWLPARHAARLDPVAALRDT